jgi:hypothetical protein
MRLKGAVSYSQMMMTTDDVDRPKEGKEKDYTDKIMVFQSLERPRGVGVRYCFEFEAKMLAILKVQLYLSDAMVAAYSAV